MEQFLKFDNKDNDIKVIREKPIPLCSFNATAVVGPAGTGKTYIACQIMQMYSDISNQQYNIEQPFNITFTPFTHQYLVSPTANKDLTIYSNKLLVNFIKVEPDIIPKMMNDINDMNARFIKVSEFQQSVRTMNLKQIKQQAQINYKQGLSYIQWSKQLKDDCNYILKTLDLIHQISLIYEQLKIPMNQNEYTDLDDIAFCCGHKIIDKIWIRRPKIQILMDDISGLRAVSGTTTSNPLFQMLVQRRHNSIFNWIINVHAISMLYGRLKDQFTSYILFRDIDGEALKKFFQNTFTAKSEKYTDDQLNQIYQKHMGFIEDLKKDPNKKHNFLFLISQPDPQIWLNFDVRVV